jgi:hypothetical protein
MKRLSCTFVVLAMVAGCGAEVPPAQQLVLDAAEAMGGGDRVSAVRTLVLEGGGMNGAMGGSATPDTPPNRFAISEFRLALDLENDRMRLQQVRTAQFVFANATVVRQDLRLDGDVAFNVVVGRAGTQRASDAAARARRLQMLEHPLVLVRAALEPGATASNLRDEHGEPHVDITTAAGETVTLGVDPETGLPSHVSRREYDAGWGDVVIETVFADYETIEGLAVPTRVTTTTDEWLTADITFTGVQVDVEVEDPRNRATRIGPNAG